MMKKVLTLAALAFGLMLLAFLLSSRFVTTNAAAFDDFPPTSKTQPDNAPLGKDSKDKTWGEVAFDHKKHSTDAMYSVDGKKAVGCTECHHTDQPAAGKCGASTKDVTYTTFQRKDCLTTAELAAADSPPVKSCGSCHFQKDSAPSGKTMPINADSKELNNKEAFHTHCISCHKQAKEARTDLDESSVPTKCAACHKKK